jgi:hypothetical protein
VRKSLILPGGHADALERLLNQTPAGYELVRLTLSTG